MAQRKATLQPTYKKTLCLGGSFNPIHFGHLICSRAVAESLGFEQVMLIPSGQPPHKPKSTDLADAAQRLTMCTLAIDIPSGESRVAFGISDLEVRRKGPSYTIDTVREMKKRGHSKVHWLIGADMLNFLPKWHEAAALINEVEFVVVARPGVAFEWNRLPKGFAKLKKRLVGAPLIEISASEIRHRVREGSSIDFLTPSKVVDYIHRQGLYRT